MPVSTLLVEGKLDAEILGELFASITTIEAAKCSKNALAPRTRTERQGSRKNTYYIRDRDYDYPPPDQLMTPEIDRWEDERRQSILGWRWCRHSLECYMLEPSIVSVALSMDRADYIAALTDAAHRIRFYQAARWAIGSARGALPPSHEFQTFPFEAGSREFYLPEDLSQDSSRLWSKSHAEAFFQNISGVLNQEIICQSFQSKVALFSDQLLASHDQILLWFSGKDLMTAMKEWLHGKGIHHPGDFRTKLFLWMRSHPEEVLAMLPEWQSFINNVKTHP